MNVKKNGIGVIILLLGLAAMGYLQPAFMALDLPEAYAALLWFLTSVLLVFIIPSIAFGEREEIKEFMSYLATFTGWVVLLTITYTCWGILPSVIVLGIGGLFLMGGIGVLAGTATNKAGGGGGAREKEREYYGPPGKHFDEYGRYTGESIQDGRRIIHRDAYGNYIGQSELTNYGTVRHWDEFGNYKGETKRKREDN